MTKPRCGRCGQESTEGFSSCPSCGWNADANVVTSSPEPTEQHLPQAVAPWKIGPLRPAVGVAIFLVCLATALVLLLVKPGDWAEQDTYLHDGNEDAAAEQIEQGVP